MNSTELISMWDSFKEEGMKFAAHDDPEDDEVLLTIHSGDSGTTLFVPKALLSSYTVARVNEVKKSQVGFLHQLLRDI
jgi:hypothetical protein